MDKDASILLFENEVEKNKLEKWINNIKLVSKTKLDSIYEVDIYWDIKRFLDDMNRRGETFGTIIYRIEHIEKNTYRVIQRNNNSFYAMEIFKEIFKLLSSWIISIDENETSFFNSFLFNGQVDYYKAYKELQKLKDSDIKSKDFLKKCFCGYYQNDSTTLNDDKLKRLSNTLFLSDNSSMKLLFAECNGDLELYKKALDDQYPESIFQYGLLYYQGQYKMRIERDYNESFKHLKKAADMGHIESCYYTGISFLNGYGTKKDRNQANRYLSIASNHNFLDSKLLLEKTDIFVDDDIIKNKKIDEKRAEIHKLYGQFQYTIESHERIIRDYERLKHLLIDRYNDFYQYFSRKALIDAFSSETRKFPYPKNVFIALQRYTYSVSFIEDIGGIDYQKVITFNLEDIFLPIENMYSIYHPDKHFKGFSQKSRSSRYNKLDIEILNSSYYDVISIKRAKSMIDEHISLENHFISRFLLYLRLSIELNNPEYLSGKLDDFENYVSAIIPQERNQFGYYDICFFHDDSDRYDFSRERKYVINSFVLNLKTNEMTDYILKSDKEKLEILALSKNRDCSMNIIESNIIPSKFAVGDEVTHPNFGLGFIVEITSEIYKVAFKMPYGIKRISKNDPLLTWSAPQKCIQL